MRWLWIGQTAIAGGVAILGAVAPVLAQVTYNVSPVDDAPPSALPEHRQPVPRSGDARVTLNVIDSTVEYVVREIARQAHLQPVFNVGMLVSKHISVHLRDVPPMDAFATALRGTGFEARLAPDGETVVIRGVKGGATANTQRAVGIVVGRVTDSTTRAGLSGASVHIAGAKISTITSDSGNFTLRDVPAGNQVVIVRLFGYKPVDQTVTVVDSQRTVVRIVMVSVPTVLSGVVTTATGVQRKIEVGSDITTLNVDSIMRVAPITTMTDLLETRVPGMTVLHSDGVPGDPARIRLRGVGSVQLDNDPVIIIDGIRVYSNQSDPRNQNLAQSGVNAHPSYNAPSPLDQIDPNNIATVEVLKGPSATAIYGSDAANGVIVVTTKHGTNGPTHWSLSMSDGVNWLPGDWPNNYYRFGSSDVGMYAPSICYWYDPTCHVDSVVAFQALNDPRYTVFSHGGDQQANLTVSGGTPTLTYSLTGSGSGTSGYLKLPGSEQARYDSLYGGSYGDLPKSLIHPDQYTTWSVGGHLTAQPYQSMRVTLQSSLFSGHQQHSSLESAILQLEGVYVNPLIQTGPLIDQEYERATDDQLSALNAVQVHWQPRSWLPIDVTGGLNTIQRTDVTYVPFGICDDVPGVTSTCGGDTTGSYGSGRGSSRNQTLQAATAVPLFANKVTLAVGGNVYSQSTADFSVFTNQLSPGVSVPTTFTTNSGCGTAQLCNSPTEQNTSNLSTYGWYVEPRLNVASRFFAAPGFRLDGGAGQRRARGVWAV